MHIELIIDVIASIIGFISIGLLWNLNRQLGGKMSGALRWFIAGIVFMAFAFIWSSFFGHGDFSSILSMTKEAGMPMNSNAMSADAVDIHHVFMAFGMILFIVSAKKFSSLIKND